jgi:rhodanese-related sulfurtransferase
MKLARSGALTLILALAAAAAPLRGADSPKQESPAGKATVRNVGVEEFDTLRANKEFVVLDVRTEGEFSKGHIPGAVLLDFNSPDFSKKVAQLDKNKTYLVHCAAGARSAKACSLMDKLEFKHLVNLEPGFRAWEKAGKPVEKKP